MRKSPPSISWLLFSFKGRIARQSFLMSAFLLLLPQFYLFYKIGTSEKDSGEIAGWALIWLFVSVVTLWSALAITVKRLHDLSLPASLAILMIVPTVNFFAMLVLAFMPSKQEHNEFGPPPFEER